MRLLFVADLHYSLKQFDWLTAHAGDYDLAVIGGDLLDLGSALDSDVQIVVVEKYLERIRKKTRLLVSSGNHDGDSHNAAGESVATWLHAARTEGLSVDGDSVAMNGVLVTICPWWDGPISRGEIETMLARETARSREKWVWIHHAPPNRSPVSWTGKKFGGDEPLVDWIGRFRPDIVLSGHIHNSPFHAAGSWVDRIGHTWVFNPGRQPGPSPTYITIELPAMTAHWISAEGESIRQLTMADG